MEPMMINKPGKKTVAILTIGTELTLGEQDDGNRFWLAKTLSERGYSIRLMLSLPDDEQWIAYWIQLLTTHCDAIITSGGIGGTHDDVTRTAIGKAFQRKMVYHPEAKACLEKHYGSEISGSRLAMAYLPEDCGLITNPLSNAPGFFVENVYAYPGFPEMLELMIDEHFPPLDQQRSARASLLIEGREGDLAPYMAQLDEEYPDVSLGSYPGFKRDGYYVRVMIRGVVEQVEEVKQRFLHILAEEFPMYGVTDES